MFLYRPEICYCKRFKFQIIEYVLTCTYMYLDVCYCGTCRVLTVNQNFTKGEIRIF